MMQIGGAGGHGFTRGVRPQTTPLGNGMATPRPAPAAKASVRMLRFAGQRVKVMTYNMEMFDGKASKAKKQALAQVIQKEDPEILMMQEVADEKSVRQFVKDYLNNDYPHVAFYDDPNIRPGAKYSGMGQAILSKNPYPMSDYQTHVNEINPRGFRRFTRDLGQVTVWIGQFPLTLFNAHFKSMFHGEQASIIRREEEARTALKVMAQQSGKNPYFMLAGDLNTKPTSAYGEKTLELLKANAGQQFKWMPIEGKQAFPMVETFELFQQQPVPTNNPNSPHLKPVKLDYMFVSKPLSQQMKQTYASGDMFKNPWQKGSDHLPLVSVFEVPDKPLPFTVKKT